MLIFVLSWLCVSLVVVWGLGKIIRTMGADADEPVKPDEPAYNLKEAA